MKHPNLEQILDKIKHYFSSVYQDQLKSIILYGSQARGNSSETSDIDILVILKTSIDPYQEIDRTSHFIAKLCLEYDVVISRHFISQEKFQSHSNPFLCNVRKEGIFL